VPVLALVIALRDAFGVGTQDPGFSPVEMGLSLAFMATVFLCVLLHEIGHVLTGLRAGGWAPQILLWPLGGLADVRGVPPAPRPQILLAASGPLVNLSLAAVLLPVLIALELPVFHSASLPPAQRLLVQTFLANVILFGLNLVPAFPLDGGAVLRWSLAALSRDGDLTRATLAAAAVGKVSAVLLGVAGVVFWTHSYASLLFFLALFSWLACEREKRLALQRLAEPEEGPSFLDPEAEAEPPEPQPRPPGFLERWRERRRIRRREKEVRREVEVRQRVDALLQKIAQSGMGALTAKEQAFLREASKRYQKDGTAKS
jgi:Zn-dependent protease